MKSTFALLLLSAGSFAFGASHENTFHQQGTIAEMGVNVLDEIRSFGKAGKIFLVHFRFVKGTVPRYTEVFIDEGDRDPLESMKAYCEVGFGGPAMVRTKLEWTDELEHWLEPFLARLGHKARRRMCPLYIAGLIGPGDRKSVQPMAERLAPGGYDRLHHLVAAGVWDEAPLEAALLGYANQLVGGDDAVLVVDDTALPKKGIRTPTARPWSR